MRFSFAILASKDIEQIIPLVYELNEQSISKENLKERFTEMQQQNYECAVALIDGAIVGVCGLWFCTRHYAGKSVELDHVYIMPKYRNKGLGKAFMKWINNYVNTKGCLAIELNTYVQNYPSHKFYYNEGFEILGYHFLKKL